MINPEFHLKMPLRKWLKHSAWLFALVGFLSACDCNREVAGHVLDEVTGQPVRDAQVYNLHRYWEHEPSTATDSLGGFNLADISGGLTGCPPMKIRIEKQGYKSVDTEIEAGGEKTIHLKREQQ